MFSIQVEEEYRLMDLAAIISATGGSLGLFLGFSFYGGAWNVVKWIAVTYRTLTKKRGREFARSGKG
jgi:hypothetical protein